VRASSASPTPIVKGYDGHEARSFFPIDYINLDILSHQQTVRLSETTCLSSFLVIACQLPVLRYHHLAPSVYSEVQLEPPSNHKKSKQTNKQHYTQKMRFATLATACVAALTSINAQAIDQAYIGVSPPCPPVDRGGPPKWKYRLCGE
jgi:hypothetical protein